MSSNKPAMAPFTSPYPPIDAPKESYATFLLKDDPYHPETPAYIDGISGQTNTRRAHREQVMTLAAGLRNVEQVGLLPLRKGSIVVVFSPNSLLYPVVMMAMVSHPSRSLRLRADGAFRRRVWQGFGPRT